MFRNPRVFAIQRKDFVGQNLEHPGAKVGVVMVAVEGSEPIHHGVLIGIRKIAFVPDQASAINLKLALDRAQQFEKSVSLLLVFAHHVSIS